MFKLASGTVELKFSFLAAKNSVFSDATAKNRTVFSSFLGIASDYFPKTESKDAAFGKPH